MLLLEVSTVVHTRIYFGNDGYSVSYAVEQADGQTMEELIRKKAYEAASTYLLPTGWLSRKVGCCHADECDDYNL